MTHSVILSTTSFYLLIVSFFLNIGNGSGIRCMRCSSYTSNDDCNSNGLPATCKSGEVCKNILRIIGDRNLFQKSCSIERLCTNRCSQNGINAICTQCCAANDCNKDLLISPPDKSMTSLSKTHKRTILSCENHYLPFGSIRCTKVKNSAQRTCLFWCSHGYILSGPARLICTQRSHGVSWSGVPPKCVQKKFSQNLQNPGDCSNLEYNKDVMKMSCSDQFHFKSRCTFTCNDGYYMLSGTTQDVIRSGTLQTTCWRGTNDPVVWTEPVPKCVFKRCPILTSSKGTLALCSNWVRIGSVCSFSCRRGYEIAGERHTSCIISDEDQTVAIWNTTVPRCKPRKCPTLDRSENISLHCTNENTYGSQCWFNCQRGYFLKGQDDLIPANKRVESLCTVNDNDIMLWSPAQYTCDIKSCRGAVRIKDGNYTCTNGNQYLSRCTFDCGDAFLLLGKTTITCLDNSSKNERHGLWDFRKPWCRPKVCTPLVFNNNTMNATCTNGIQFGSICTFACLPGHIMTSYDERLITKGELTTECHINSKREIVWNKKVPICHSRLCHKLEAPENGEVLCTNQNNHMSVCTFSCYAGYIVQGEEVIVCEDKGSVIPQPKWSHSAPHCATKPCERLSYNHKTTSLECSNGFVFMSTCYFKCRTGYYMSIPETEDMVNTSISVCRLNTKSELEWSTQAPECILKTCLPLRITDLMTLECSANENYGSTCIYSCLPGYELDGDGVLKCVDDGTIERLGVWNKVVPQCKPRLCSDLEIDAAVMNAECEASFQYLSRCNISCITGYYMSTLDGSKINRDFFTKCDISGKNMIWSKPLPKCEVKFCPSIVNPKNGIVICDNENIYGSTCSFICYPGYEINGPSTITCIDKVKNESKGYWTKEPPTCTKRQCARPGIEGLRLLYENCSLHYLFESICFYSCVENYFLKASGIVAAVNRFPIKCGVTGANMTWSSELPTCEKKTCVELRMPKNGNLQCTSKNEIASICTFICNRGYILVGENRLTCLAPKQNKAIGVWSSDLPFCEEKTCPELNNGSLNTMCTNGLKFKSICHHSCGNGYYMTERDHSELIPAMNTTCEENDEGDMVWSNESPVCKVKSCKEVIIPNNGSSSCTNGNVFNSVCVYSCLPGYTMKGNKTSSCIIDVKGELYAKWNNLSPHCEPRSCPELFFRNSVVRCSNGVRFRSECTLGCNKGWYLASPSGKEPVSSDIIICSVKENEMYWTPRSSRCLPKHCKKISDPKDGKVKCTNENKYLSLCAFSCTNVHELDGKSNLTCEDDGTNVPFGMWSGTVPTCKLRSCQPWEFDTLAIAETCSNDYKYGSSCFYSCKKGYYRPDRIESPELEDFVIATCGIEGINMKWSGNLPVCEIKTCKPMIFPDDGLYTCTNGTVYNSKCTFKCDPGFLLIGRKTISCQDDGLPGPIGMWDGVEPVCEARSCSDLLYESETQVVNCSLGNKYGSDCGFKCREGYYMTEADGVSLTVFSNVLCDVHPKNNRLVQWRGSPPKCFIKTCPKVIPPEEGSVSCDKGTLYGSRCKFSCLPGFKISGLSQTSCRDDGNNVPEAVWSKAPPLCKPKSCPKLINNDNTTNFKCTDGWKYRSICTFTCNPGYFITKGDGRTLVKSGKSSTSCGRGTGKGMSWTKSIPNCQSKFCFAIRPQRNRTMECTNAFRFKSRCTFRCDESFSLIGKSAITCINVEGSRPSFHGKWDAKIPKCEL